MGMTIDDSERYLRIGLGGMKYAARYWKDRDEEEFDIAQTNVEAVEIALETMSKYQKICKILDKSGNGEQCMYDTLQEIEEVVENGNDN